MEPAVPFLKLLTLAGFALRPDVDWHRTASPFANMSPALRSPCVKREYRGPT